MLLFCLPHAGATGISYYRWKPLLNSEIELITIDLPGHKNGDGTVPASNFEMAINSVYMQIKNVIQERDDNYIIFGHSLGALIAYELYFLLLENKQRLPLKMYISGRIPPSINKDFLRDKIIREEDAKKYLMHNGLDTVDEKKDTYLIKYYSNLLLADMKLMGTYKYIEHDTPVLVDTIVLFGKEDNSTPYRDIKQWGKLCGGNISFVQIQGGHLFPLEQAAEVVNLINNIG